MEKIQKTTIPVIRADIKISLEIVQCHELVPCIKDHTKKKDD